MNGRLKLCLPSREGWDYEKEEYVTFGGQEIELEHSLYTMAAWEAKWKVPFSSKQGLTHKQLLDYIMSFMCQTPDVPKSAWLTLDEKSLKAIQVYMEDSCTAMTIKTYGQKKTSKRELVTAETLYCYMFQLGIPLECERWHLNRLMALIDMCAIKSAPPKKMSRKEAAMLQQQQNAKMRAKLGSRG